MRSAGRAAASWRLLLLSLLWTVAYAKDEPSITVQQFDNPPININYFEDSDVIVFHDVAEGNIYRSEDAGVSWGQVSSIPEGRAGRLFMHSFEPKTAFVITDSDKHYKSEDRGATWKEFSSGALPSTYQSDTFVFHATDPNRIIFNGMVCEGIFCDEQAMYTTDGFKTVKLLRSFTAGCWWAKSSPEFSTGQEKLDSDRTLCVVRDPFSFFKEDQRLYVSDVFFAVSNDVIQEEEPNLDTNKGVAGVANLAFVKKYLLVATSSMNSDEMALYVTDDTINWHRAMFPTDSSHDHSHQINQEAYTVLEGTNYSIQVDVMTSHPSNPMGVLFTSNSNGTYFTENVEFTNRNPNGFVDFEKISGIQGIFLVNVVENGADVDEKGAEKKIVTKISFDDGRTFETIKAGDDQIHLHSVTELNNVGRVFSSPAPGLVMGNGNTGATLGKFSEANLYVSDNAGLTWKQALEGPHKYEFGDSGSILVAVWDSDKEDVAKVWYSLDHGEKWDFLKLPKDMKVRPLILTTTQDSTSLKFLLLAEKENAYQMIAIDFEGLNKPSCGKDDMEEWHARVDDDGKPTCIMGHKQTYRRRKKTADCFIKDEFKDPVPQTDDCDCTDADFECDYNFQRDPEDRKVCKLVGHVPIPEGACKSPDDTFKGTSGWRLIPGNTCKRTKGEQKDDEVERKCSDVDASPMPPANGSITHKEFLFESKLQGLQDFNKVYLDRSDSNAGADETVIARPIAYTKNGVDVENAIYLTSDHGKTWKRILEDEKIVNIIPHQYFKDVVFFTTSTEKVIYSIDRGSSFHTFQAPTETKDGTLSFHSDKKDWLIWVGTKCEEVQQSQCFREAFLSTDRGDNWNTIVRYVEKCEFTGNSAYRFRPLKQIVCLAGMEEKNDAVLTIYWSNDFFETKESYGSRVTNFATMSEFIVVAGRSDKDDDGLKALVSMDGEHYENAHFPYNFHLDHQSEYTVLDSSTHAVNLFVATDVGEGREQGSIIKSNSNGTSYVLIASNVNSNEGGYVDFEKVVGVEGVTLINVVANPTQGKEKKKLQTKISHNDGAEWSYLAPPAKDVDGKAYQCSSSNGDEKCALHIHHYTERDDKRRTFAATTTVGILFAIGNVGSEMGDIQDADTFMTTDGGITWKNVKKGHWTWQYGDQGSVIVLVQRATHGSDIKTKMVSYSTDEGNTWQDYQFTDEDVTVLDITTLRSGTSRNFLVWCRSEKGQTFSVNLDFSGLTDKPCTVSEGDDSDYYLWSPKHPLQDDECLFGHVAKYLRKKPDRVCFNEQSLKRRPKFTNCECSRRDYEW